VSGNLSQYLYTPSDLRSDRTNLNGSWYSVSENYHPLEEYFSIDVNGNGIYSTEDGWPSEAYVELSKSKRLLVGWGTVDIQMRGYNFTGDSGTIFPSGYLQSVQMDVTVSNAGQLTSGCFLGNVTQDLTKVNSSWASEATLAGFDYPTNASSGMWTMFCSWKMYTIRYSFQQSFNTTAANLPPSKFKLGLVHCLKVQTRLAILPSSSISSECSAALTNFSQTSFPSLTLLLIR